MTTLRYQVQELVFDGVRISGSSRIEFLVPIRTGRGLNDREHRLARSRRIERERNAVLLCWPRIPVPVPCEVLLTRYARRRGRLLDDDNLQGALKAIRDEVARLLGVDDADPRVSWAYAQDGSDQSGVQVVIRARVGGEVLPEIPRASRKKKDAAARVKGGLRAVPSYVPPPKEEP
jgi:hypothetical protein